jgi:hypothetical protein
VTIDDLLEQHQPEIAALARRLIDHIDSSAGWSDVKVYPGWHGLGFHHPDVGYIVGVFPRRASVRVLFEYGHLLGEAPFLEGSGQTRHITFTEWAADRLSAVDDMLARALM